MCTIYKKVEILIRLFVVVTDTNAKPTGGHHGHGDCDHDMNTTAASIANELARKKHHGGGGKKYFTGNKNTVQSVMVTPKGIVCNCKSCVSQRTTGGAHSNSKCGVCTGGNGTSSSNSNTNTGGPIKNSASTTPVNSDSSSYLAFRTGAPHNSHKPAAKADAANHNSGECTYLNCPHHSPFKQQQS